MKAALGITILLGAVWGFAPGRAEMLPARESPGRILVLGDSHSLGVFGENLDRSLREDGFEVHTYASAAGGPYVWLERFTPITASLGCWEKTPGNERREELCVAVPKVESLLQTCRPQVVVVQAGLQLIPPLQGGASGGREQVTAVVDEFCRVLTRSRAWVYWVNLPKAHPKRIAPEMQSDLTALVREVVERYHGRVFDSAVVTEWSVPYPELSDGLHYGVVEGRQWAEAVASDFRGYWETVKNEEPPGLEEGNTAPLPVVSPAVPGRHAAGPLRARVIGVPESVEASDELQVKVILRRKSEIENPGTIQGGSAFGLFEYEVAKVYQGHYPGDRLRVAHLLVLHAQPTAPNQFEVGKAFHLSLVRMGRYPSLDSIPLVNQLEPDETLPVYICRY